MDYPAQSIRSHDTSSLMDGNVSVADTLMSFYVFRIQKLHSAGTEYRGQSDRGQTPNNVIKLTDRKGCAGL